MLLPRSICIGLATFAVLSLGVLRVTYAEAAENFEQDGWHTWRVAAIADAPDWCCYDWNAGRASRKACNLGSEHISYGAPGEHAVTPEFMQVYALVDDGEIARIQTLSAQCAVESDKPLIDLGIIDTATSVHWLAEGISPRNGLSPHVLASIAVHDGAVAKNSLEDIARRDRELENRKDAVFWMAQARVGDSGSVVRELMRDDDDGELRQHALFSYAQSTAADRVEALIDVIEDRKLSQDDRRNALFWLAQTESAQALDYLERLLVNN